MKTKILLMLLTVCMLSAMISSIPITAFAETVASGTYGDDDVSMENFVVENGVIIEYTGNETDVVIPSEINGETITKIDDSAFEECLSIKTVSIPDSIAEIGYNTFAFCENLKTVYIGTGLTDIHGSCFEGCDSLSGIYVDSNNNYLMSENNVLYNKNKTALIKYPAQKTDANFQISNTVTNIYDFAFESCASLKNVVIPYGVTDIGNSAFYCCAKLDNIEIPDSVIYIGGWAFYGTAYYNDKSNWDNETLYMGKFLLHSKAKGSYSIKEGTVNICDGAFLNDEDVSKLTSVKIPNSVTSIGNSAFYACKNLTNIVIPNSAICIKAFAFAECVKLKEITIGKKVDTIGYNPFYNCKSIEKIYWNATDVDCDQGLFSFNSKNIGIDGEGIEIIFGDNVKKIPSYLFYGSEILKSVTLGKNVKETGSYSFSNCPKLQSVKWNAVSVINENSYYSSFEYSGIDSGIKLEISNDVKTIPEFAFCNVNLKDFTIPKSVTSIGDSAFNNISAKITMSGNKIKVGDYAFENCRNLAANNIQLESIGEHAFENCDKLTKVVISDSAECIGNYAFFGCTGLKTIQIGKKVTDIGWNAFSMCPNTEKVIWKAKNTRIDDDGTFVNLGINTSGTEFVFTDDVESIPSELFCSSYELLNDDGYPTWYDNAQYNVKTLKIGENVDNIGSLYNLNSLKNVYWNTNYVIQNPFYYYDDIKNAVLIIGNDAGIPDCAKYFSSILLSNGIRYIYSYEFSDGNIEKIVFSDSVESIGDYAFSDCENLVNISIPNNVTRIGEWAFLNCSNLKKIKLSKNITQIKSGTFFECYNLKEIDIPNGVETLGSESFAWCENLENVTIPKSVRAIYMDAFKECNNLTDVWYSGTEEDWNKISITTGNTCLTNATIHYNYKSETGDDDNDNNTDYEYNTDLKYHVVRYDELFNDFSLYQITSNTDLSYLNHTASFSDCWEGQLVLVKCKNSDNDDYELLKVYKLKEYTGTVESATDNTITLNGTTYNIGRNLIYTDPNDENASPFYGINGSHTPDSYIGEYVCIRTCNSEVVSISIPQWDRSDSKILREIDEEEQSLSISKGYYSASKYYLSKAAKVQFDDIKDYVNNYIQYLYDEYGNIYDISEYEKMEISFYDTYKPSTWEEVENAAKEFVVAAEAYNNGIVELLNNKDTEKEKQEKARKNGAIQLMAKDDVSSSKFLTFSAGTSDNVKIYAYEALYDALEQAYDGTGVDLGDIKISGDIITSNTKIVNKIIDGFNNSTSFTKKYDDYTVSVNMNSFGLGTAVHFGTMTLKNKNGNTIDGNIVICSSTEDIEKAYVVYFSQLKELAKNSIEGACDAVLKELSGKALKDWGKLGLKNVLKKYKPELLSKGAGDVYSAVNTTYKTYEKIQDILKLKDAREEKKMDKALSTYKSLITEYYSDKSISDKIVDSLYSTLSNKFTTFAGLLDSYTTNTKTEETKKDGWFASIKCPTNVYVYDNEDNLIGFIEGNYIKYDDEIYLEKIGDVKKVWLPNIDDYQIKVVTTDDGTLNYSIEQYVKNAPVGRINYYDIEIYEGKEILSSYSSNTIKDYDKMLLKSDSETITGEYISSSDNANVIICGEVKGNGYITGLGSYVKGDGVVLSAVPDEDSLFAGWYIDDELVSTNSTYTFSAKQEMSLLAEFIIDEDVEHITFKETENKIIVKSQESFNDVELIVAVYSGEKLLNIKTATVSISVGENDFESPITDYADGDSIKVMIWNSISDLKPLFEVCNVVLD